MPVGRKVPDIWGLFRPRSVFIYVCRGCVCTRSQTQDSPLLCREIKLQDPHPVWRFANRHLRPPGDHIEGERAGSQGLGGRQPTQPSR